MPVAILTAHRGRNSHEMLDLSPRRLALSGLCSPQHWSEHMHNFHPGTGTIHRQKKLTVHCTHSDSSKPLRHALRWTRDYCISQFLQSPTLTSFFSGRPDALITSTFRRPANNSKTNFLQCTAIAENATQSTHSSYFELKTQLDVSCEVTS